MIQFFAGSIANPKMKQLSADKVAFCCSALTTPDGNLYWPAADPKPHSSAKAYTSLFARHWDTWTSENQNSLWYGLLTKANGHWTLEPPGLINLLQGTRLSSPIPPFGGTGDFDLTNLGIAFVAKDPELNPARYTKSDLYFVPLSSYTEKPTQPQIVKTGELRGYSTSPTFSKDGKRLAFARMKSEQYESDKPRLLVIPDVTDLSNVQEFYKTDDGKGGWSLRPDTIEWSHNDEELFVTAESEGRNRLWRLPSSPAKATSPPNEIHIDGSVIEFKRLGSSKSLLISARSLVESSFYSIFDTDGNTTDEISSSLKHGKTVGLNRSQCSEIKWEGAAGYPIHALVMFPSSFDDKKKYPLAMLIHGGPQSAWSDDWSTRWNPAIFAEQGYVVVCPNPTGSTGYGQDHIDAIAQNWGGAPYEDLVKGFEFIKNHLEYVDTERAVALGGSYGGYMISKSARNFCTMVTPSNPLLRLDPGT